MAKIGFIGMGNMGYAMLKGALAAFSPSDIIFSSPDREKCERISSETGVRFAEVMLNVATMPSILCLQ